MAGTLPNLPLSTQFDKETGRPLKGGRLIFYAASAPSSPATAYKDVGLTLPWGDRITLDGAGRVPMFYLPDGNIGVRLTNSRGVVQLEESNLLVIGPSAGGGGGGGSVDANAIFKTGDVLWLDASGSRSGWVRDNGRTIGSAASGASERANSDCEGLFLFLWGAYSNAICPVLGGRGASAAADWAADKQITLPDKRGYLPGGLDDMGNAAAGRLNGVPFTLGDAVTAGALCGEEKHALTVNELAAHTHANVLHDPGHAHYISQRYPAIGGTPTAAGQGADGGPLNTATATTGITLTNASAGGGNAHNNTPRTVLGTFYRKL